MPFGHKNHKPGYGWNAAMGYGVLHMKVKLIIHLIDLYTF